MGHHLPNETNVTTLIPRCAEIAHHVLGLGPTKSECDFSVTRHEGGDVSLDGQVVIQKDTFRYLGSVLQKDGDID